MNDRMIFALVAVVVVGAIQIAAFAVGMNGQVFNFTTLIIGAIVGSVLGVSVKLKRPHNSDIEVKLQP